MRKILPLLAMLLAPASVPAGEIELRLSVAAETKAVFGRIETRDVIPARSRLGGTLVRLDVTEGDGVAEGQRIARVIDDKLALQLKAAEARIKALGAERINAEAELDRQNTLLARGFGTRQRADQLKAQSEVLKNQIAAAEAERSVILQQASEGDVLAPVAGRIIKVPVSAGAVVMPGEQIAMVAGSGFFLRLALPERHAAGLKVGAEVNIAREDGQPAKGRLAKVFPQIENGRVIADVEVADLNTFFVGARVLVQVPVGTRTVLAVPEAAV
ncbi:MAG: efflux RND transporter periplasmic adaptor subunit, partial [Proteobacteria bacterium]|nr:efflux RND transporter periplasmic adaptor subunit [Pseudomonadota bacterium]